MFAYAGIKALVALIPDGLIPREAQIRLNVPVMLFSLATAIVDGADIRARAGVADGARRIIVEPLQGFG